MPKKISFSRWREHRRACSRTIIIIWAIIAGYWLLRGSSQSEENLQTETFDVGTDDLSNTFPSANWKIEHRSSFNKDQRLLSTPNTIIDAQENGSSITILIRERATAERLSRLYDGRSRNLPLQSTRVEKGSIMNLAEVNRLSSNAQQIDEDVAASISMDNDNQSSNLLALRPEEKLHTGEDFESEKDDVVEFDAQSYPNDDSLGAVPRLYEVIPESSYVSEGFSQAGNLTQKEEVSTKNSHSGKQLQTTIKQDQGKGDKLGKFVLGSNIRSSSRRCRTVEEMGAAAASDSTLASLRVRELIQAYLAEHGAEHVKSLPRGQFCKRKFVFGRAQGDGFGNEMYKILTAAGLAIMLNRSLIIGEHSSTNPSYLGLSGKMEVSFGDYIMYSNQTFSMREVKHLWVIHGCPDVYKRPLTMRLDSIVRPSSTSALCEDWTKWQHPIIWFKGAEDAVALQLFIKNVHPAMNIAASLLLGDPGEPRSRPNVFGELMRAFIEPLPLLNEAVDWALQGGPSPDIALHLRMLSSSSHDAADAASKCIQKIIAVLPEIGRKCRVVLVSDTPSAISYVKEKLGNTAEVIHFSHERYLHSRMNLSTAMSEHYLQPPRKRIRDWGSLPRWVALVDFFLASRAKYAVVSGAYKRVGTTFAQLIGSLASANNLNESNSSIGKFHFYSSFQAPILGQGLAWQRGRGHLWRTFGGRLSCTNQRDQCALTPVFPYAWWDGPMQSPIQGDIRKLRAFGIQLGQTGEVVSEILKSYCLSRRKPTVQILKLQLPSCKQLKTCH